MERISKMISRRLSILVPVKPQPLEIMKQKIIEDRGGGV